MSTTDTENESIDKIVRDKIVSILTVYPKLSPSMLQIGLGNGLSSSIWKPILNDMVEEGIVKTYEVPAEGLRTFSRSYKVVELVNNSD